MTDTPPTETCVKWTLSADDVVVEVTATMDDNGNIVFSYELLSGTADLNGLYLDLDNDGGSIRKLEGGNNMNGSDSDGDKLDGFDWAKVIGTVGGNDADTTSGTATLTPTDMLKLGITGLADLDGAEIGIRATSVGDDREGSLKLANTGTYCEPVDPEEPEELCDRPVDGQSVDGYVPMQDSQIVSLTFAFYHVSQPGIDGYFNTPGDTSDDWYYAVTINVPAEMGEDPDAYMDEIIALLVEQDPFVDAAYAAMENDTYFVKSVIVTDCHGNSENYAIELDSNGELPDLLPDGSFGDDDGILDENTNLAGHIDATYDLAISGDEFAFV